MDTRPESIAPVGNIIRTLRKRDRLFNMVLVEQEHVRIAKERFQRYENALPAYIKTYKEWCVNNQVPSLMD